jgi:hypothetical protein
VRSNLLRDEPVFTCCFSIVGCKFQGRDQMNKNAVPFRIDDDFSGSYDDESSPAIMPPNGSVRRYADAQHMCRANLR